MTIFLCTETDVGGGRGGACPNCGGSVFADRGVNGEPLPDPGPFDALDGHRYCSEDCAEERAADNARWVARPPCTVCGSSNDRVCLDGGPCTRVAVA